MRLLVSYEARCIHSEQSDEMYGPWYEDWDFNITSVHIVNETFNSGHYQEDVFLIEDDAKQAYVIVMRYSTGDSFGNADGKGEVVHAFGNKEAAEAALAKIKTQEDEWSFEFLDDFGREVKYHNSGAGYFEHITSLEIETFAI